MAISQKYCTYCNDRTKHVSNLNVGLHVVLILITATLWLLPLLVILLTGAGSKWACDVCGYEWRPVSRGNRERLTPHERIKRRRDNPDFDHELDSDLDDTISESLEGRFD